MTLSKKGIVTYSHNDYKCNLYTKGEHYGYTNFTCLTRNIFESSRLVELDERVDYFEFKVLRNRSRLPCSR